MDIHGNSVGKANLRPGVPISEMVWNCERFNMEEPVEPASVMNVNNIFPNNVHPPKDPKPYQRSDGEYTDLGSLIWNTHCGNVKFSATHILCGVNFGHFEALKTCFFDHLSSSDF